jgi:hypothetical protein
VAYERDGEIQRLSEHWPDAPTWVRGATRAFEIATSAPLLPVLRFAVWLAGASTSHRASPRIAVETPAALPAPGAPYQETIG